MELKYSFLLKDKYPIITKRIIDIWKLYSDAPPEDSAKTHNKMIEISKRLQGFCKANDLNWMTIADIIDKMLNDWRTYKPKHLGYLGNDIFWQDILPKELIRYGLADKGKKWVRI